MIFIFWNVPIVKFCRIRLGPHYFSWPLVLGLYKEVYLHIFKCVSVWLRSFCGKWECSDPVNLFNHTNLVAITSPTHRPKLVYNRCVIEILVAFLWCHVFYGFFCGCRDFSHRTESDLFLFLLWKFEFEPYLYGLDATMQNTKVLMHCHCGTNNRAPPWTFTDPCKPKAKQVPGRSRRLLFG